MDCKGRRAGRSRLSFQRKLRLLGLSEVTRMGLLHPERTTDRNPFQRKIKTLPSPVYFRPHCPSNLGPLCITRGFQSRNPLENKISSLKSTNTFRVLAFVRLGFTDANLTRQEIGLILFYTSQSEQQIIFKNTVGCQVGGSSPYQGDTKGRS